MDEAKILYLINSLRSGGTEHSLVELLPGVAAAGFRPSIACFDGGLNGSTKAAVHDYSFHLLEQSGRLGRILKLRSLLEEERPQLLHTALWEANLTGRLAAIGKSVPVLTSLVSTSYAPERARNPAIRTWKLRSAQLLDACTARRLTNHFHAVSHTVKAAAVRDLGIPPERITVIERGRDSKRLGKPGAERRQQARRALGLSENDEVLVNVGRHEFAKDQVHLIQVMRQLSLGRPRTILLIAGREGGMTPNLINLRSEEGLDDRVRLLGHRDDVPEILAAADLFVFSSLYEGLPGAVLEAMALGLPIVASDIPAVREVVEHGRSALLVPEKDVAAFAAAVESLLDDRKLAGSLGTRSRALFEERFTLDRSAQRMIQLYRELTSGTNANS